MIFLESDRFLGGFKENHENSFVTLCKIWFCEWLNKLVKTF